VRSYEIVLRAALIIGAVEAVLDGGVTVWFTGLLGLVAIAATAELAMRPYADNPADRLLLACGALVTALILIGLCLNLTPWGLTRVTWTFAWAIVSAGVLIWRRGLGLHIARPRSSMGVSGIWGVAAAAVLVASIVLAMIGVRQWNQKPLLAFSLVGRSEHSALVEIQATSTKGRYDIVAASSAPGAHRYLSKAFAINVGGGEERVHELVPLNVAGRWTIILESANDSGSLRELIIDVD
jgi:hypothetical protein